MKFASQSPQSVANCVQQSQGVGTRNRMGRNRKGKKLYDWLCEQEAAYCSSKHKESISAL